MASLCTCSYSSNPAVAPGSFYSTTKAAINNMVKTYPSVAKTIPTDKATDDINSLTESITAFIAASAEVDVVVCPLNCFNLGSFHGRFESLTK
jgi:hypothetical protein